MDLFLNRPPLRKPICFVTLWVADHEVTDDQTAALRNAGAVASTHAAYQPLRTLKERINLRKFRCEGINVFGKVHVPCPMADLGFFGWQLLQRRTRRSKKSPITQCPCGFGRRDAVAGPKE